MENMDINIDIDRAVMEYININKEILENIDINIDINKEILENIHIDKEILENIDKISNRLEFGISNRAIGFSAPWQVLLLWTKFGFANLQEYVWLRKQGCMLQKK